MRPAAEPDDHAHDAFAALCLPDFRLLIGANFLVSFAQAVLSVLVGWELYVRTGSALALGLVGLVQIVPNVLFSIPAGQLVDRHDQQRIAMLATALVAAAAIMLTLLAATTGPLVLIYAALFVIGIGRAFRGTTQGALMAAIVPPPASPTPRPGTAAPARPPPSSAPPSAASASPSPGKRPPSSPPPPRCWSWR